MVEDDFRFEDVGDQPGVVVEYVMSNLHVVS